MEWNEWIKDRVMLYNVAVKSDHDSESLERLVDMAAEAELYDQDTEYGDPYGAYYTHWVPVTYASEVLPASIWDKVYAPCITDVERKEFCQRVRMRMFGQVREIAEHYDVGS